MLPLFSVATAEIADGLSLKKALQLAQESDPWLNKSKNQQAMLMAQGTASNVLPDPTLAVNLANIPTDTFEFNQEAMTQFKVGISQMLPRGDTLSLKSKQFKTLGEQQPWLRENRKAKISLIVTNLWLDAYKAQAKINLINKNKGLFEQLIEVAESGYSSSYSKAHQQDIIRAELELIRLEDKLAKLQQSQEVALKKMNEWIYPNSSDGINSSVQRIKLFGYQNVSNRLPTINTLFSEKILADTSNLYESMEVLTQVKQHPLVTSVDKKIEANEVGIELAKQSYKPEWGFNASYAYRDNSSTGINRADFLSVGVTVSLPLFSSIKQDSQVEAAIAKKEASKDDKWLVMRSMVSGIEAETAKLQQLSKRQKLYQKKLLPQMHQQADAALNAYSNDVSDFAEVVRARIAELNTSIEAISIDVEKNKTIMQLNYYFTRKASQLVNAVNALGESYE